MNMMTIEEAEDEVRWKEKRLENTLHDLKIFIGNAEHQSKNLELLKTQIASARIDGKKEFDADTYMKGKKK